MHSNTSLRAKAHIIEENVTPIIELGLVERTGKHGGLGAGLYTAPMSIFKDAFETVNTNS